MLLIVIIFKINLNIVNRNLKNSFKQFNYKVLDNMNEKYMSTNRLEAFYDAIIAIIVTILVLECPNLLQHPSNPF